MKGSFFERWFWEPVDPRRLAVVRIATVLVLLDWYFWRVPRHVTGVPAELVAPVGVAWPLFLGGAPSDRTLDVLQWLVLGGLACVFVGLKTRVASVATAVLGVLYLGVTPSFGKITCLATPLPVLLLFGAVAPWGDALSIDAWRARRMPAPSHVHGAAVRALQAWLGLSYASAAVQKLLHDAPGWFDGSALRGYLFSVDYFGWYTDAAVALGHANTWLGGWIVAHPTWCTLFGIGTLLFEGTFVVAFFARRLVPLFIVGGVLFHVSIFFAMSIRGYPLLPFYLAFLPTERALAWVAARLPGRRAPAPAAS